MEARLRHDTETERTPLVYVPGVDGTGELLLGTGDLLAERLRLVRLRYEATAKPLDGDGYRALAASIASKVRSRGIDRTLIVAESFGVAVALRLALDHPELVGGMMLVNGFAHYAWRTKLAVSRLTSSFVPEPLFMLGRRWFAPRALFGPRRDADAEKRFLQLVGQSFDVGYRKRLDMIARLDLRSRLSEIEAPIRIIASDGDRIVPSVASGRAMRDRLPNANLEVLKGCGHVVLPFENEPWIERLEQLLARTDLED